MHGKFNTTSISNQGAFCNWFSLAPKRKMYKIYRIHKLPFKNVISLAIERKMYLKIQQKLCCLGFKTGHPLCHKENKVEFLNGRFSWWKASLLPQKENWAFLWSLSFHFLFFDSVFLNLKCRTLVSKLPDGDWAAAILLRFPNMVKVNIHEHWMRVTRFNP